MRRALAALQASLLEAAACSSASVSGRGSAAAASGAAAWRSGAAAPPAALRWASSAAAPQADSEGPSASTSASASGSSSSSEPAAGAGPSSSGSGGGGGGGLTPEQQRSLLSGKRFYKTVRVEAAPQGGGWQLLLDTYPVRTPARNLITTPSYPLALALAAEWEWLPNGKPIIHAMPLMSLAATAIDQPKPRARVIDDLLKYVHTDAACVRYEPGPLATRQAQTFDPLLAWAKERMGWDLAASDDIAGPNQPPDTLAAVRAYLEGLDAWHLAAAEQLTASCKSVVLTAALLHGRITPAAALEASRLEESFQIEDWGMVEAGHDLDIADQTNRVTAPAVLVQLLAAGGARGSGGGGSGGGSGNARAAG